jgi:hypothetical protein
MPDNTGQFYGTETGQNMLAQPTEDKTAISGCWQTCCNQGRSRALQV